MKPGVKTWAGLVLALTAAAEARAVVVEVAAGAHDRGATLVVLRLPDGLKAARGFTLDGLDDRRRVPAQVVPGKTPGLAWVVGPMKAGATRRYRLEPTDRPGNEGASTAAACEDDGKGLVLEAGGTPVLRYNYAVLEPPAGIDPVFRRGGFIHPLFTPAGAVVTDDFPPDHAHQHGVFFAWVNTTYGGRDVDFWNQAKKTGDVRHAAITGTESGPVFAGFSARLRHVDVGRPGAPAAAALDESWTVRASRPDPGGPFVVDFESEQACAGATPLQINKYHYGGFGVRGARGWFDPGAMGNDPPAPARAGESDFLTSEGKTRSDGNHTRPRWVDLSGKVGGAFAGVAVLDHPGNFRAPQPVRLHPNKPYFVFAPMVKGAFTVAPGAPYVSRYRLVLHDGRPDPAALDRLYRDYAEPPPVRVVDGE